MFADEIGLSWASLARSGKHWQSAVSVAESNSCRQKKQKREEEKRRIVLSWLGFCSLDAYCGACYQDFSLVPKPSSPI